MYQCFNLIFVRDTSQVNLLCHGHVSRHIYFNKLLSPLEILLVVLVRNSIT